MFRIRINSVYATRGTSAVVRDNPVHGIRNTNSAIDGIVYSTPVTPMTGGYRRR